MNRNLLKAWILPLLLSLVIFVAVRPVLAQQLDMGLSDYIKTNDLQVGAEVVNGYQQVFYIYQGNKHFITNESRNSNNPYTKGSYIVYVSSFNEAGQVFLFDIVANTKTQLTFLGTNLNPKVDDRGRVVWESWDGTTWQIYFFDGKSIKELTGGDLSLNPEISGDFITYGRRDISGTWRAILYSIKDKKTMDITVGEKARNPKIKDGKIYLAAGSDVEEEFPLTVDDLFLLNLVPLSATSSASPSASPTGELAPQTVTEEEIAQELQATESATPQASPSGKLEL